MQISSDLKSLELLVKEEWRRENPLQFCEDLEFPGIPGNSQLYSILKITFKVFIEGKLMSNKCESPV